MRRWENEREGRGEEPEDDVWLHWKPGEDSLRSYFGGREDVEGKGEGTGKFEGKEEMPESREEAGVKDSVRASGAVGGETESCLKPGIGKGQ